MAPREQKNAGGQRSKHRSGNPSGGRPGKRHAGSQKTAKGRHGAKHQAKGRREDPTRSPEAATQEEERAPVRLNRYIAQAGICARRKADEMISRGLVRVNGEVVTALGTKVAPGDVVVVNGKEISPQKHAYYLLNKPHDTITTKDDERDRKTVMDLLNVPENLKDSLFPVGRLDRHTLGALLITNDGELAHRLMHPRYRVGKYYRVTTQEPVTDEQLAQLTQGIELEDGVAKADRAGYLDPQDPRVIGLLLYEGRNRQIRRMLTALGHDTLRLERVRYAGLDLKGLRRGKWRRLTPKEIEKLNHLVKR